MEKKRQKLLIYSDCFVYGGSERLMSFLLRNTIIKNHFEVFFVYRDHKTYKKAIYNDYSELERLNHRPISILSNETFFYRINQCACPAIFKSFLKMPFFIFEKVGLYFLYNIFSQASVLLKISPNIIHINNGGYPGASSCNTLVVTAKLLKYKNVLYQINNVAQKPNSAYRRVFNKFLDKNISYFIVASKHLKNCLIQDLLFDKRKIKQVLNTVSEALPQESRRELLKSLNIAENDFVLCSVGFLFKSKGHQFLLSAINEIRLIQPDIFKKIKLLIVGDGPEGEDLRLYLNQNHLNHNVFLLGYQNNASEYINACDLFVFPSIADEDMPLVLLTAMSFGKIIVSTNLAGIVEEIEDGKSGFLLSADPDTLTSSLTNIIIDLYKNKYSNIGEDAKERYMNYFSNEKYGLSLLSLYNEFDT